jgi:hypothetical protein
MGGMASQQLPARLPPSATVTKSKARARPSNIKLLAERDLLVQSALFDDEVLLKVFGASEISWGKANGLRFEGSSRSRSRRSPSFFHLRIWRGSILSGDTHL